MLPSDYLTVAGKECGRCGKVFPKTLEYFETDKSKRDGLRGWCKTCRKERREVRNAAKAVDLVQSLDKAVIENLAHARPGGNITPHQLEFYQCLTTLFGGVQGVAMQFVSTYIAANPGSQTRERLLGQYCKLMAACSNDQKVSPPAELMSDEELSAAIERDEERMKRNEQKMREGSIDGSVNHGNE